MSARDDYKAMLANLTAEVQRLGPPPPGSPTLVAKFRCPFHNERTPSANIRSDGKFICFGCNAVGTWTEVEGGYEITTGEGVRRCWPCT